MGTDVCPCDVEWIFVPHLMKPMWPVKRGCLLILVFPINSFIPCNSICVISVTRSQCPVTPVCLFVPFSHQSVYLAFVNCWVAVACRVSDEGDSEA